MQLTSIGIRFFSVSQTFRTLRRKHTAHFQDDVTSNRLLPSSSVKNSINILYLGEHLGDLLTNNSQEGIPHLAMEFGSKNLYSFGEQHHQSKTWPLFKQFFISYIKLDYKEVPI